MPKYKSIAPSFTYVFRRWLDEFGESMQATVVIIKSDKPMYPDELLTKLERAVACAHEYVLVESPSDSFMVLDTWEKHIDAEVPVGEEIRQYEQWWSHASVRRYTPVTDDPVEIVA